MTDPTHEDTTKNGADARIDAMLDRTYSGLRALGQRLISTASGHSVQGTELVHEAIIKLLPRSQFSDDRHFYNAVAQCMRQALVDRTRAKGTLKRGGSNRERAEAGRVLHNATLESGCEQPTDHDSLVMEAVHMLEKSDLTSAEVVHLWLLGHSRADMAQILDLSEARVRRLLENGLAYVRIRVERNHEL